MGTPSQGRMASEDPQQLFERYDRNKSGALEVEELRTLLADMGLLTNKTLAEVDSFVVQQFAAADADKDSKLNLEEFTAYYGKVRCCAIVLNTHNTRCPGDTFIQAL